MGERIALDTADGRIGAWLAAPETVARGGIVVVQEIFGVNAHMRSLADRFAALGFLAIAPALFDPVEAGVELGYDAAGVARGRELVGALGFDRALEGVRAAAAQLHAILWHTHPLESPHTNVRASASDAPETNVRASAPDAHRAVAAIGYCWGGSVAFLANTRLGLPAVSYYGARSMPFIHEPLRAPMLFHFGERDASIPAADIAATRAAQPHAQVRVWPAGHGFNCDLRPDYDADSAAGALAITLDFIAGLSG